MENQKEQQQRAYKQEAYDLLSEFESALMELEEIPDNEDLIGRVFRAMHTIKGSGAMFGFNAIAAFTHEVETVFDLVRDGDITVTRELINLSLSAKDLIAEMLDSSETDNPIEPEKAESIITGLKALIPPLPSDEKDFSDTSKSTDIVDFTEIEEAPVITYRIRFRPPQDIFANGTNPVLLLNEFSQLGECHIVAHTDQIPLLSDITPECCYFFWDIILTTDKGRDAIEDVFIFVSDISRISIQVIDEDNCSDSTLEYKKLGEILVERGDLTHEEVLNMLEGQKRIGEMLTEAGMVSSETVESALVEQEYIKKTRQKRQEVESTSSLRVDASKLDTLVDLVGELVTVQARLSQQAASADNSDIVLIAEEVERLVNELRDNTMSIRMLPIGTTFSKFKRLVRDLSESLGKEIILTTEGGDTELDKTVLEKLNDPLVHIIRNSIDHGIETPAERSVLGKPENGKIHLSAGHKGANVVIHIMDDGAGLDSDAIRKTAISRNLMTAEEELPESELLGMIFTPGFSTIETVTDVSGRGVGMDVVKKGIEALRGGIGIRSKKGEGTTITLELPLTLAIIEGFMVMIGDEHFVFPLATVEECVEMTGTEMENVRRRNMMNIRGEIVPYQNLREVFNIERKLSDSERIVVVGSGEQRVGFGVDSVIGQHQTVIKSLGKMYRDINGVSGATILGDGSVALILDVAQLISNADTLN